MTSSSHKSPRHHFETPPDNHQGYYHSSNAAKAHKQIKILLIEHKTYARI